MNNQRLPLPPGWVQATDPNSGRIYYANPLTKETRWDPPPPPPTPKLSSSIIDAPSSAGGSGGSGSGGQHSFGSHGRSNILTGNPLYSAVDNAAYDNPAQLVAMTRNMLDKAAAFPEQTINSDLELHSITPGQIADLCQLQQQQQQQSSAAAAFSGDKNNEQIVAYTPINPYRITTTSKTQITEKARLDVRARSLKEKLVQFGGRKPDF